MSNKQSTDIFISYRREDGEVFASRLADALIAAGYDVFFDRNSLEMGCVFPDEIQTALEHCTEFIAVCSPAYLGANRDGLCRIQDKDDWVARELEIALDRHIHIFPITVADATLPDKEELPHRLSRILDYNFRSFAAGDELGSLVTSLASRFHAETRERKNRAALIQHLEEIGDGEENIDFNIQLRSLVMQMTEDEIEAYLRPLITTNDCSERVHFAAYYATYTFYRRFFSHHSIEELVETFSDRFRAFRFNHIILSQYYRFRFEDSGHRPEDLHRAIHYAKQGVNTIDGNSGVLLTYAELIAVALENSIKVRKRDLHDAIQCVEKALEIKPEYPKLYATLGRLLAFDGRVNEAFMNINRAMDLEDAQKKDAFLRINQYQSYITDIKIRQLKQRILHMVAAIAIGLAALIVFALAVTLLFL